MPTAEEQVFTLGTDLTPTLGAGVALIEQAIELATTTSYRGLVIYSDTTPATSGEPSGYPTGWYEWHKRCLWLKPSTGEVFQWNGTTWALSIAKPGANTITGSMIASATIPISKFLPDAGSSLKVIRVNLGESAFEYIAPADLFSANSIAISKLDGTSSGDYVLTRAAGSKSWTLFDSATIIGLFGANEFPIDYLTRGSALQVPMVNAGATATTWASVLSGIADYTVPLTKISKTIADAGKWLKVQPDGSLLAETLPTSSSAAVNFASSGEVVSGAEAAKAIAPSTARYIQGATRALAFVSLAINSGGTDTLTGCSLVAGSVGVSSVTFLTATTFRITFSEALFTSIRKVQIYPTALDGDQTYIVPAALTVVPGKTITAAYDTDSSLIITMSSAATVPSTGDYLMYITVE
jgi:hypothetical protein